MFKKIFILTIFFLSFINMYAKADSPYLYHIVDNGYLGGWNMDYYDKLLYGRFSYYPTTSNLLTVSAGGWATLSYWGAGYPNYWTHFWSNGGNGWIGPGGSNGWHMEYDDEYKILNPRPLYSAYSSLFCVNKRVQWAMVQTYNTSLSRFDPVWSNSGNNWINSWGMSTNDRYYTGDVNNDNSETDLLSINPNNGWAMIQSFSSGTWTHIWNNNGSGNINGWNLTTNDKIIEGNFDGDAGTEFLFTNYTNGWASIMQYQSGQWQTLWANYGSGWINGWNLAQDDQYITGNLVYGNEVLFVNTGSSDWAAVQTYNGGWTVRWANGGNRYISNWEITYYDRYLLARLDGNHAKDVILTYNSERNMNGLISYYVPSEDEDNFSNTTKLSEKVDDVNKTIDNNENVSYRSYPNPFNPVTTIEYNVKLAGNVKLTIYNSLGKEVGVLVNQIQNPGTYKTLFNAQDMASGMYYYKLEVNGEIYIDKMMLVK